MEAETMMAHCEKHDIKAGLPPMLLLFLKMALAKFGPALLELLEAWLNAQKEELAATTFG